LLSFLLSKSNYPDQALEEGREVEEEVLLLVLVWA